MYGDVFGTQAASQAAEASGPVAHWGELQDDDEDDSEEEEESEEDEDADDDESGAATPSGMDTPMTDGISSVVSGLETPDTIELRKGSRNDGSETPVDTQPPELYKVLTQEKAQDQGGLYGSRYDMIVYVCMYVCMYVCACE